MSAKKSQDDQPAMDDVLRRMLAMPPEPHKPATASKPKPKKKPAKKKPA